MKIGTRVIAPDGYRQLTKDTFYYCLHNNAARPDVLFVRFDWQGRRQPIANVFGMRREEFEHGIDENLIIETTTQPSLPPWLEKFEGTSLASLDAARKNPKLRHYARITNRCALIAPAIEQLPRILDSDDVHREIHIVARSLHPPQNESRYRLWLLTYICFGQNIWALLPPFHRAGCWDRERDGRRKAGRPSKFKGRHHGFPMTQELAERCEKAYLSHVKLGKPMTVIFSEAMNQEFGCRSITGDYGLLGYIHPQGDPFPSERQFRYHVAKRLGIATIQFNRYGRTRHRNKKAVPRGRYSESVANINEKIECDGYFTLERPRGYTEGSVLPPLCVVVSRDFLAGNKLGIGFSLGAEIGAAYRMMLFSMAVPKDYFCMLWGIEGITRAMWPSEGLAPDIKFDRGPGANANLVEKSVRPVFRCLAPSYTPQSKATIESSHPREVHMQGEPTYIASNHTPVELCKREIRGLIAYNNTADMSDRMELDRALAYIPPSPNDIWKHYDSRFRNSAISVSIADAVRAFLTPVQFKMTKEGVFLDNRWYTSPELEETGLLEKLARGHKETIPCPGYILDLCLRHVWIDVGGRILLLKGRLRTREDDALLDVSAMEHQQALEARAVVNSAFRAHKAAFRSKMMEQHKEDTGKSWFSGTKRTGKPRRDEVAVQEAREVRQHTSRRGKS